MSDPCEILDSILGKYNDHYKWSKSRFEKIKRISNQKVGHIGQEFVEILCSEFGFAVEFPTNISGKRTTQSSWDIKIEGIAFEQKTATEDSSEKFQFNHIRLHREYQAVLCVGISPSNILFGLWSKAEITTGKAGRLVTMEKGANASYKLTKGVLDLHPISEFKQRLLNFLIEEGT